MHVRIRNNLLRIILCLLFLYRENCSRLDFKVLSETNWHDAVSKCEDIGMQLATIKTQEMQTEIDRLFTDNVIDSSFQLWIGLYWKAINQSFHWIDGELMTFSNWDGTGEEPNFLQPYNTTQIDNSYYENCVRIVSGLWRTRECNTLHQVLCISYENTTFAISTISRVTETTYAVSSTNENEKYSTSQNRRDASMTFTEDTVFQTTALPRFRAIVLCPDQAASICDCEIIKNISTTVKRNTEDHIYRIFKTKTNAYHRHHNCAHDERFSAKVIGLTGSAVLGVVLLCIVCCDIARVPIGEQKKTKKCS